MYAPWAIESVYGGVRREQLQVFFFFVLTNDKNTVTLDFNVKKK